MIAATLLCCVICGESKPVSECLHVYKGNIDSGYTGTTICMPCANSTDIAALTTDPYIRAAIITSWLREIGNVAG